MSLMPPCARPRTAKQRQNEQRPLLSHPPQAPNDPLIFHNLSAKRKGYDMDCHGALAVLQLLLSAPVVPEARGPCATGLLR